MVEDSVQHLAYLSKDTKLDLAKCSYLFYSTEWDPDAPDPDQNFIEGITWSLARDEDTSVRRELAVQLSACDRLPMDLAEEIACDIEFVSIPFIAATKLFDDEQMAELVPFLKNRTVGVLAKRPDLEDKTIYAIALYCNAAGAKTLVDNKIIYISEETAQKLVERFRTNKSVMDILALRLDLPSTVLKTIVSLVSPLVQKKLKGDVASAPGVVVAKVNTGVSDLMCQQLSGATLQQVHAIAINYRQRHKVSYVQVLDIAKRESIHFLVSILALESGETIGKVRDILTLSDHTSFIRLLRDAGVSKNLVPYILSFARDQKGLLHPE